MARRVAALLLALGTAVVLLAAPGPAPAGAAVEAAVGAAAPGAGRPAVGDCHALTSRENQASVDPDRAVPCTQRHTTVTFKVPTVRRAVARDLEANFDVAYRVCRPALARALRATERTLAVSAYTMTIFAPTRRQVAAGARWLRCDVFLPVGPRGLAPLPTDRAPVVGRRLPLPNKISRCGNAGRSGFSRTVCTARHEFRARGSVVVRSRRFPGEDALVAIARRRCPSIAGRRYYPTWPLEQFWASEPQPRIVCYRRTGR